MTAKELERYFARIDRAILIGFCIVGLIVIPSIWFTAEAQVRISALPDSAAITGTEQIPSVQAGATTKATPAQIATYVRSTITTLASGTFTPTCAAQANVASFTCYDGFYSRVGNIVTVGYNIEVTPTLISTITQLGVTLPIPSAFTTNLQAAGSCAGEAYGRLWSNSVTDGVSLSFVSLSTTLEPIACTLVYQVL